MRYATLRYGTAEMENGLNLFFRIISSKHFELSTRSNEEETAPKPKVINQACQFDSSLLEDASTNCECLHLI